MTISAAAKQRGISRQAVDKFVKAGNLNVWIDPTDKSSRRRLIDLVELDQVRGAPSTLHVREAEPDDPAPDAASQQRRDADTRRAEYAARKLELEVQEREGKLVSVDEVAEAHEAAAGDVRRAVDSLGVQLKSDPRMPASLREKIDDLIASALGGLSTSFDKAARQSAIKGVAIVMAALAVGFHVPEKVDAATWAEQSGFVVPDGELAGHTINWDLTPYSRNILKCLAANNYVAIRKSSQTGLTTAAIAWLGSLIDLEPNSALCVQATMPKAREFSETKLTPAFTGTPALRKKVREEKQNSKRASTGTKKRYGPFVLNICGGNSASDLSGGTYKYIVADDIDQYPKDLDGQGEPMRLIRARQKSFLAAGTWKRLVLGTPTIKGASRSDEEFLKGDQRYLHLKCPKCSTTQKLTFDRLKYDEGSQPNADMKCVKGCRIEEHHKPAMVLEACAHNDWEGRWIPENPDGLHPSFHVDALHSLLETWDSVVLDYLSAKGDPLEMQGFYNLTLGLSYEETGEGLAAPKLHEARGPHTIGHLPKGFLVTTAAVDVQGNRLEYGVYAWGPSSVAGVPNGALIDKGVIEGDPAGVEVWDELDRVLARTYENDTHSTGIDLTAVDTGYLTNRVYRYCMGRHDVKAIDGRGDPLMPPNGTPKKKPVFNRAGRAFGSVMLHPVGSYGLKSEVLGAVGRTLGEDVKPGAVRYPMDCDLDYFEQIAAETLVTQTNRSTRQAFQKWVRKEGQANEALDIAVYARAMAHLIGVFRSTPEQWKAVFIERSKLPEHELPGLEELWLGMAPKKPDAAPARPSRKQRVMDAIRRHNESISGSAP